MEYQVHHTVGEGDEEDYAVQGTHWEGVSQSVEVTIEHHIPRRLVRVTLYTDDYYLLSNTRIDECEFGEHDPVVDNQYCVRIRFNTAFSGIVRLDY